MTVSMRWVGIWVLERRESTAENMPSWASWRAHFSVGTLVPWNINGGP